MATLKKYESNRTAYEGLWYRPESHLYMSKVFNLAALREYKGGFKVIVRKNKYYKKDTDRPNLVFSIVSVDEAEHYEDVKVRQTLLKDRLDELIYTYGDIKDVAYYAAHAVECGETAEDAISNAINVVYLRQTVGDLLEELIMEEER